MGNQTLKTNIAEHKEEIKLLRHGTTNTNNNYNHQQFAERSELTQTLKNNLQCKINEILSLKEELSSLKQANNALSDRYDSNINKKETEHSQIEQLRETLSDTQRRESKLMKDLNEQRMEVQKFRMESEQYQSQIIDIKQQNNKLLQQLKYFKYNNSTNDNFNNFEEYEAITNKLEIASKNAEQFKLTNVKMHDQINFLKKEYESLHDELTKKDLLINQLKESKEIIGKKYEILKEHWGGMNEDRSKAIEQLKNEEMQSKKKINELKNEIKKKQIELQKTQKMEMAQQQKHIMNEVKVQEEIQTLKQENISLKETVEQKNYDI